MSDSPLSTPKLSSYHDFGGLASLRGEAAQGEAGAVRETAKQFEVYFIQHMMKTMRESIEKSELTESGNADMFQDMMDKEVATKMAERGALGMADMIERNLAQRSQPSTLEALSARDKSLLPQPAQPMSLQSSPAGGLPAPRQGGSLPLKARAILKGVSDE